MKGATSREQLHALLAPAVQAQGLDLEDVVVTPAGRRRLVRVVVDRDGGVPLDTVADVSTAVGALLDEADTFGESPYVLEVTSPGIDRPLTEPRHWRRNVGRLVRVVVSRAEPGAPPENVVARVLAVDDLGVSLAPEPEVVGKQGSKQGSKQAGSKGSKGGKGGKAGAADGSGESLHLPWAELGAGRVQVEFGRTEPTADEELIDEPDGSEEGEV